MLTRRLAPVDGYIYIYIQVGEMENDMCMAS